MIYITTEQILRETSLGMLDLRKETVPINTFYHIKCRLNKELKNRAFVSMLTRDIFDVPVIYPDLFTVHGRNLSITGGRDAICREIDVTVPVSLEDTVRNSILAVLQR